MKYVFRAVRRRRTSLVVKRRRWFVTDGPFGIISHPAEFGFFGTDEEYQKDLVKYYIDLDRRLGRCKCRHPWDCGRTRCGICSRHKRPREYSLKEINAIVDFREQLDDFWSLT